MTMAFHALDWKALLLKTYAVIYLRPSKVIRSWTQNAGAGQTNLPAVEHKIAFTMEWNGQFRN
jgi:hypothetical protein